MTIRRMHILAFVALMVLPSISGCEKIKQSSVAGTYVSEKNVKDYLELKADGTFFSQEQTGWGNQTRGMTGKYEIDAGQITLKLESGQAARGKIDGKTIVDNEGIRWTKK